MGIFDFGKFNGIVRALAGFVVLVATVLAFNFMSATRFANNAPAIQQVALQKTQPAYMNAAAQAISARLEKGEDVVPALEDLNRARVAFDETLTALSTGGSVKAADGSMVRLSVSGDEAKSAVDAANKAWADLKTKLDPVTRFSGTPYSNSEGALSSRGETLKNQLAELKAKSAKVHDELSNKMGVIAADIESSSASLATTQRIVLGVGIVAALLVLFSIQFIFVKNLQK